MRILDEHVVLEGSARLCGSDLSHWAPGKGGWRIGAVEVVTLGQSKPA